MVECAQIHPSGEAAMATRARLRSTVTALGLGAMALAAAVTAPSAQSPAAQPETPISFTGVIQPILQRSCWTCHGARLQLSKLDLRTREAALRGGARGPALIPGKAEQSSLYRAIAHLDAIKMPMQADQLAPEEIAAVKAWIDQGAAWDAVATTAADTSASSAPIAIEDMPLTSEQRNYWAFQLPVQAPLPVVARRDLTNPIDRFLESERSSRRLVAAPRADKRTLVRRAYLDLLGLPPTPAQVDAFVADDSPQAWERLIDTLLASPHYGERYGRHWLDVARYADSAGFEYDTHRANAWRYRDYVIKSFNDDKPYDRFIVEQLAGDELDDKTHDTLIATGFLRAGPRVLFREKDNPERRFDYLDEILGTIGKGMLGLTVNCARCHNHKFDPISQKDYYSLQASIFGYVETEVPLAPRGEADVYLAKMAEIDAALEKLRAAVTEIERPHRTRLELEQIKLRFPEHIFKAASKAESERTPGEKLLATQIFAAVNVPVAQVDKSLSPEEAVRKKSLTDEIAALNARRPPPLPMIEIATDGDYRFSPLGEGDETISCPKCRIPPPFPGTYVHKDGKYQRAAVGTFSFAGTRRAAGHRWRLASSPSPRMGTRPAPFHDRTATRRAAGWRWRSGSRRGRTP